MYDTNTAAICSFRDEVCWGKILRHPKCSLKEVKKELIKNEDNEVNKSNLNDVHIRLYYDSLFTLGCLDFINF